MKLPLKTLIVEDTEKEMRVLLLRLHAAFFRCFESYSYEGAKALLASEPGNFHLSVLDIKLPRKHTSYELIDEFGKLKFGILAFTTVVEEIKRKYLPEDHPPFFIEKPFNEFQIQETIDRILDYFAQLRAVDGVALKYHFIYGDGMPLSLGRSHILFVKAADDYTRLYFIKDGLIRNELIKLGLSEMKEHKLKDDVFIQIGRSLILNFENLEYVLSEKSLHNENDLRLTWLIAIRIEFKARFFKNKVRRR